MSKIDDSYISRKQRAEAEALLDALDAVAGSEGDCIQALLTFADSMGTARRSLSMRELAPIALVVLFGEDLDEEANQVEDAHEGENDD